MQKIMIIEDDPAIREELILILTNEGYSALAITDFLQVLEQISSTNPDLILLDLGLPNQDGFSLCADIHKIANVPIIFVTSRDSALDELRALSLGGDDYITKPYNISVLLARIKAVLRRSGSTIDSDTLTANGLSLSLTKGIISSGTQTAELSRNEIKILAYLMNHPKEIVSRSDLIETLWDNHIYIDDNTLSVNITRLRAKLEEIGLSGYIKTRRGLGYQI